MTKTITQMLADLNLARQAKGQKPLKNWKGSTVKLAEMVAKMGISISRGAPAVAEGAYVNARDAEHRTGVKQAAKQPATKAASAPAGRAATHTPRTLDAGELHLSDIAATIKLSPKAARVLARKHKSAIAALQVKGKKYVFPVAAKPRVLKLLQGE